MSIKGEVLCSIPSRQSHVSLFLNHHWDNAEEVQKETGLPMAVCLAIWCLESKYGKNPIKPYNIGSIRKNGAYVCYDSEAAFLDDFKSIFKKPCYSEWKPETIDEWISALDKECCRYAMSKRYTKKIKQIIKKYNLDKIPY